MQFLMKQKTAVNHQKTAYSGHFCKGQSKLIFLLKNKNAAMRRNQIAAQRSGCDLERRSSGMSAL